MTTPITTTTNNSQMKQMKDITKRNCMVSFRLLHSNFKVLSNNNLKGTQTEERFKRAFVTLFRQDSTQDIVSKVHQITVSLDDDDGLMILNYFLEYTRTEVQQVHDTLIQHMESVKKSIDERASHKREYHSRVNEIQMHTKEGKVDTGKALDTSLFVTESSGTLSEKLDTSSSSGNDADDVDIQPIYNEEPIAEI
ncbi:hypothetical protein Tco_0897753 [Tanacetum coccineum]